jgi:hypothetical protein
MTYARKVDANQPEIVKAFRECGASVLPLHRVGKGCPDLLVAKGETFLAEIKDGSKRPSARKLRDTQEDFRASWRGRVEIVESVDDVLRIMGART